MNIAGYGAAVFALIRSGGLMAAWPRTAFDTGVVSRALHELTGLDEIVDSDRIELDLPASARNGAVVAVTVSTTLENVERISLLVELNPWTLAADFPIHPGQLPYVSTRIKIAMDSKVFAVVQADGKLHRAEKSIRVLEGGCVTS